MRYRICVMCITVLGMVDPGGRLRFQVIASIRGVYKKVSPAYLQTYLDEYSWRHNAGRADGTSFGQLLRRAPTGRP